MPKLTAVLEICSRCAHQLANTDEGVKFYQDRRPAINRLNIMCAHYVPQGLRGHIGPPTAETIVRELGDKD